MKILLVGINAKYIHSSPALYYLKSYAMHEMEDEKISEETIQIREFTINQEKEDIVRNIFLEKPDVVAFSCYLWNISYVYAIIKAIAKVCPQTDIWLGGPEVSFDPLEQIKKYPMVRGIMAGEGEKNFVILVKKYLTGDELNLPKVMFSEDNLSFDEVPFPYDDLSVFENRIVYYETSRGCPFGCTYCLSSVDTRVRLRSIELVREELQKFLDAKIPLVKFVDRTFNCNPLHTLEILRYIKENDNGITCFHFEMAAELITEEELLILESLRPGQVQIEVGIQTTNCDTLKAIHRKADMVNLGRIVRRLLASEKMHVHVDLIAGLPYEDIDSFKKSFNDVYALHAHELQLGFLKVLKGSPMEAETAEYEIVYGDEPPYEVLSTKWLKYEEIIELKGVEEMLEVYYNSGQFINSMRFIENNTEYGNQPYEIYLGLYQYYFENGLYAVNHNRYERYEILRNYGANLFEGNAELFEDFTETILHDLYLRDNVKSRPSYGENGYVDKKEYKEFFAGGYYKLYLEGYGAYEPAQVAKMVHIEKRKRGYMLYDYLHRNPLTGNARCIFVESLKAEV